ncbi:MAG: NAD-dependent epimerase/dehydratase family protein, partial [Arenicellales bacterium]|jgi:UDP-glucose 4-epimerase|nr:NAD-dependent epimerase/dehydratase family protein [Arenicellales bacterium]|tara:strand:- start:44 stop:307 length:264 start_codon:yes stop_codon:yes gene_type:complete
LLKNVLIAGGAGYVGSLLMPQFLEDGHNVIVHDIIDFGKNTLPLDHPGLMVIESDIRDTAKLSEACEGVDPESISRVTETWFKHFAS